MLEKQKLLWPLSFLLVIVLVSEQWDVWSDLTLFLWPTTAVCKVAGQGYEYSDDCLSVELLGIHWTILISTINELITFSVQIYFGEIVDSVPDHHSKASMEIK